MKKFVKKYNKKIGTLFTKNVDFLVPMTGIEPIRYRYHCISLDFA